VLIVVVWTAQKQIEQKRAEEKTQRLRDEQAALQIETEKRRAEIRSSAQ
jgi:hypothetical protein